MYIHILVPTEVSEWTDSVRYLVPLYYTFIWHTPDFLVKPTQIANSDNRILLTHAMHVIIVHSTCGLGVNICKIYI